MLRFTIDAALFVMRLDPVWGAHSMKGKTSRVRYRKGLQVTWNHMINYDTESLGGSLHVESLKIRHMDQCNAPYGVDVREPDPLLSILRFASC